MNRRFSFLEVYYICRAFGLSVEGWLHVLADLERRQPCGR